MRITRETLLKIARDTAAERVRISHRLVSIYLTGSLLSEDPLLGGTADIDLVIIHDAEPVQVREVVRLNDEVHLDIAHLSQEHFRQPRTLRRDAWLGYYIVNHPLVLHDSGHWFDKVQAIISAQFHQPDNTLHRARAFAEDARQIWISLHEAAEWDPAHTIHTYLKALEQAANAIAVLNGAPLPERRFLLHFPLRAQALGRPQLAVDLLSQLLMGVPQATDWAAYLPAWKTALQYTAQHPQAPARLHAARLAYYERAAQSLLETTPPAALWIVLRTWARAALLFPADSAMKMDWLSAAQSMGLAADAFQARLQNLDGFLDQIEETLDEWGQKFGV